MRSVVRSKNAVEREVAAFGTMMRRLAVVKPFHPMPGIQFRELMSRG